jgi:hypothetical protein
MKLNGGQMVAADGAACSPVAHVMLARIASMTGHALPNRTDRFFGEWIMVVTPI